LRRQHSNMIHLLFPKKNCVLRFHISNFCKVFLVEFEMLFRMRPLRNKLIPLTEKISCYKLKFCSVTWSICSTYDVDDAFFFLQDNKNKICAITWKNITISGTDLSVLRLSSENNRNMKYKLRNGIAYFVFDMLLWKNFSKVIQPSILIRSLFWLWSQRTFKERDLLEINSIKLIFFFFIIDLWMMSQI